MNYLFFFFFLIIKLHHTIRHKSIINVRAHRMVKVIEHIEKDVMNVILTFLHIQIYAISLTVGSFVCFPTFFCVFFFICIFSSYFLSCDFFFLDMQHLEGQMLKKGIESDCIQVKTTHVCKRGLHLTPNVPPPHDDHYLTLVIHALNPLLLIP